MTYKKSTMKDHTTTVTALTNTRHIKQHEVLYILQTVEADAVAKKPRAGWADFWRCVLCTLAHT